MIWVFYWLSSVTRGQPGLKYHRMVNSVSNQRHKLALTRNLAPSFWGLKAELPFGPIMNGFESRPFKKDIIVQNRIKTKCWKERTLTFGYLELRRKKRFKIKKHNQLKVSQKMKLQTTNPKPSKNNCWTFESPTRWKQINFGVSRKDP